MTPRAALTKHLLDGDDSFLTGEVRQHSVKPEKPHSAVMPAVPPAAPPTPGEAAPFDADAT